MPFRAILNLTALFSRDVAGAKSTQRRNSRENEIRRTANVRPQQQAPSRLSRLRLMSNAAFRAVKGGKKELLEKLGRNDPCPCGSTRKFQEVLFKVGTL
jgi:uncharacterized protein YecA (UPF0149 family)